jgi:diguanylate cyclase (GGDEF)-like protein
VRVSISLGVATHPVHGGTPDELLKNADAALYESKAKGRNRVSVSATQRPGQELRRSYRA